MPPLPVLLRSGDALIMSGAGRRAYHGTACPPILWRPRSKAEYLSIAALPRVLEGTLPDYLRADAAEADPEWGLYGEYLERGARINVNVRSVF